MRTNMFSVSVWCAVLASVAFVTAAPADTPAELRAWWKFDECSGTNAHDSSGNGFDATFYADPQWVPGALGCALELADHDLVWEIPAAFDDTVVDGFTVAAWVYWYGPNAYGRVSIVFDARNYGVPCLGGFALAIDQDGKAYLNLYNPVRTIYCLDAVHAPNTGWTHVAATFDAEAHVLRIYLDGEENNSAPATGSYAETALEPAIGNNRWAPGDGQWAPMNGKIDDARFYDRALTAQEVHELYMLAGLRGWWKFDEGSGAVVHDSSGNGFDGTCYADPQWVPGVLGCALELADHDLVWEIPAAFDDTVVDGFTVAAWVYWYGPNAYGRVSIVFDARNHGVPCLGGFALAIDQDGKAYLNLYNPVRTIYCLDAVHAPNTGWTHVAATFDAEAHVLRIYLDGEENNSAPATGSYAETALEPAIGNNRWAPGDGQWAPMNGKIDDARFYDRALVADEVHQLYCLAAPADLNCDCQLNFEDIDAFVLALADPAEYAVQYPNCDWHRGDLDGDGRVTFHDIDPFVDLLSSGD